MVLDFQIALQISAQNFKFKLQFSEYRFEMINIKSVSVSMMKEVFEREAAPKVIIGPKAWHMGMNEKYKLGVVKNKCLRSM